MIDANFESLIKNPRMNVKIIFKNHPQQKKVNMFYQVFQCLQHCHLKI